jgi:hypothetical protein
MRTSGIRGRINAGVSNFSQLSEYILINICVASQLKKEVVHAMRLYEEKRDMYAAHRKQHSQYIDEWERRPREPTTDGKDVLSIYKNNSKKSKGSLMAVKFH